MKKIIHLIAAARPNFMKIAPLFHALKKTDWAEPVIVHTGQHYDLNMSDAFFRDLMLPEPHFHLGVGSGTHAEQTGKVMIAYEVWGPPVAEDFFYGFSGWLIFIFGLAVLLLEMGVLSGFRSFGKTLGSLGSLRSSIALKEKEDGLATDPHGFTPLNGLEPPPKEDLTGHTQTFSSADLAEEKLSAAPRHSASVPANANAPNVPDVPSVAPGSTVTRFHSQVAPESAAVHRGRHLARRTLALAQGVEFREKTPTAKSFAAFPLQVGEWAGKRDVMEEKFIKELDLNDYVIVDYVSGGHEVNFYTAYYESQRKGESIHSPETCLPGSGWEFRKAGTVTIPLPAGSGVLGSQPAPEGFNPGVQRLNESAITVNRAVMEKGATKQLSYFWFPQRDRVLTNAWELKLYNFWDALTRQRTDGALVRLITPVYPNEDVAQAEARLTAFTQAIVPVLNEYLPK